MRKRATGKQESPNAIGSPSQGGGEASASPTALPSREQYLFPSATHLVPTSFWCVVRQHPACVPHPDPQPLVSPHVPMIPKAPADFPSLLLSFPSPLPPPPLFHDLPTPAGVSRVRRGHSRRNRGGLRIQANEEGDEGSQQTRNAPLPPLLPPSPFPPSLDPYFLSPNRRRQQSQMVQRQVVA